MRNQETSDLVRPLLQDNNPRIALTAAMVLAGSKREEDTDEAEDVLNRLLTDNIASGGFISQRIFIRPPQESHFKTSKTRLIYSAQA